MHIFITGGAGFIGSHIAEYHLKKGDKVFVVDDLSTGNRENVEFLQQFQGFQFEQADILTWENLTEVIHWADRVYHMAAVVGMLRVLHEPFSVLSTNILGCERVLNAIASSKRQPQLLIPSSSSIYGKNLTAPTDEDQPVIFPSIPDFQWNYALSKLIDEIFCRAYVHEKGVKARIVRIFNMIGPRQTGRYGMVVPRFVQQAFQDGPITVFGDGKQTRSFCDVRDGVIIFDKLLNDEKTIGEVVNVGYDQEISINDLASLVKKISKKNLTIQHIAYDEVYGDAYTETWRRQPNTKKLNTLIDYQQQWCLKDTIKDLYQREQLVER